jgi:hypothetical protein
MKLKVVDYVIRLSFLVEHFVLGLKFCSKIALRTKLLIGFFRTGDDDFDSTLDRSGSRHEEEDPNADLVKLIFCKSRHFAWVALSNM